MLKDQILTQQMASRLTPCHLAPHLFELVKQKNKTVEQELCNSNWITSLCGEIASLVQLEEFVSLWIQIQDTHLHSIARDHGLHQMAMGARWTVHSQVLQ